MSLLLFVVMGVLFSALQVSHYLKTKILKTKTMSYVRCSLQRPVTAIGKKRAPFLESYRTK